MVIKSEDDGTVPVGLGEQRRTKIFSECIHYISRWYHLLCVALMFFQGSH